MKKKLDRKFVREIVVLAAVYIVSSAVCVCLVGALLCATGCSDGLDIKSDYDFEVELLPVPSTLAKDERAEMRITLVNIDGTYENTKYYLRYFQYEGKGALSDEQDMVFVPNDSYLLSKKEFRLYFMPKTGDSHNIELTFYDSFKHIHPVTLSFSLESESTDADTIQQTASGIINNHYLSLFYEKASRY
jgi:hypothetical protein